MVGMLLSNRCLPETRISIDINSMLYGLQTDDPLTLVGAALLLMLIALAACYIPARRTLGVDPMKALRHE